MTAGMLAPHVFERLRPELSKIAPLLKNTGISMRDWVRGPDQEAFYYARNGYTSLTVNVMPQREWHISLSLVLLNYHPNFKSESLISSQLSTTKLVLGSV